MNKYHAQSAVYVLLRKIHVCFVVLAIAALLPCIGRAATVTWDASGTGGNSPTDGSGTWSTGSSNWASAGSDAVWTNSNDAVIGNGGTAGTITVSGGVTVNSITFNPVASGTFYTVTGSTITLTGSSAIITNAASATVNSILAGTTGLNISGTGVLALGGAETYTGPTSVQAGILKLAGGTIQVSSTVTVSSGATFDVNGEGNGINGRNVVVISGTGAPGEYGALSNSATSGDMGVGNVTLAANATIGAASGTKLDLYGTVSGANVLTTTGSGGVDIRSTNAISGLTGLVINNNSYVVLDTAGANQNWAGPYTVNSGGNLGGYSGGTVSGSITLNGGGLFNNGTGTEVFSGPITLQANSSIGTFTNFVAANVMVSGIISGTGNLTISGGATTTFSAANTYSGTTTVNGATLVLSSTTGPAISGNISFTNQAAINTTQPNQFAAGSVLTATGATNERFDLEGNNQTLGGIIDATGLGVVQNGQIGYSGSSEATATLTIALASGSTYSFAGYMRDTDSGTNVNTRLNLAISGSGEQTLTGGNLTYTGSTTVNSGTLQLTGALGQGTYAGAITDNGAILVNATQTFSGPVTGSGVLSLLGNSLTLSGSSTFGGSLVVGNGTLMLSSTSGSALGGSINFGNSTGNSPTIITTQANQFASGMFLNYTNTGGNPRFDMEGNSQTLAGLASSNGGAVMQNGQVGYTGSSEATATLTLVLASGSSYSFNGIMRDTDNGANANTQLSLVVSGSGQQTLVGNSITYTGSTTINGGTLDIQNSTSFASSVTVNGGVEELDLSGLGANGTAYKSTIGASGTLQLNNTNTTVDGEYLTGITITGSGTLVKTGAGYLDLLGGSASIKNFTGQVNVIGGTLANNGSDWSSGAGLMNLFVSGSANFDMRVGNVIINQLTGSGTIGSTFSSPTLSVGNNNGSATFGGTITNAILGGGGSAVALTKNGTGTQTLSGPNSYTGATTINSGTLQIGNGSTGSLSNSTAITTGSLGTLVFDEATSSTQSNTISNGGMVVGAEGAGIINTLSGAISGSGGFTQSGAGETSLSAANSYSGTTSVTSGTLQLDLSGRSGEFGIPSPNSVGAAGTLIINSNSTFAIESEYSNTVSVSGSGTLNKTGAGDFEFFGGSSIKNFTGQINILNGILGTNGSDWGSSAGLINLNIASGAYLDLRTGNVVINQLTGSGTAGSSYFSGDVLSVGNNNGSSTFAGSIINSLSFISGASAGGQLSLVKNGTGTQTLSGSNGYTGTTTVNAGTLQLGNGGATGSIDSTSGVTGSSGATLVFDRSNSVTPSYLISGGMGVTQAGTGTLTIGTKSYTGPTTALSGTLIVAGSISGNIAADGGMLLVNAGDTVGGSGSVLGGTLGGAGVISGNVTVGNGSGAAGSSILWPGAGTGSAGTTLTTGSLTLNSDAEFEFTLNSGEDGISDSLMANGKLTLAGAILSGLDAGSTPLNSASGDDYIIASYSSLSGFFANAPTQDSLIQVGQNWFEVDYGSLNPDEITLISANAPIPEPGTWATVLAGLAMLIGLQRRRRSKLS